MCGRFIYVSPYLRNYPGRVALLRIKEAADLLGVSDDTVRRWIDSGALSASKDSAGRLVVEGRELAALAVEQARTPHTEVGSASSARNRFPGLVTRVVTDKVMAQVEMQCGPFTVVSLMSSEAVRELGLEPGSVALASVKATTVVVERAAG
ncbi:molybdopterin-binding protein [Nocardia ignorata]|uniref:Molybdopterin-binding protein n=1 Tax=Nocardia ignorata TaxID=145285 RepID=A0A4R6P4T2_NOCIG|nr:molybdopterin-binding protein [Nocardia ignorata]